MARYADASAVLNYGEIIDCRNLVLAFEFFELAYEDARRLSEQMAQWLLGFLEEDFVIQWKINGRAISLRSLPEVLNSKFVNGSRLQFYAGGYLKSPLVYNLQSYRRIHRYLSIPGLPGICDNPTLTIPPEYLQAEAAGKDIRKLDRLNAEGKSPEVISWDCDSDYSGFHSADFLSYWKELFGNGLPTNTEVCQRVFKLFSEKGRYYQNTYPATDIHASFGAFPYRNVPQLYHGTFSFCLNSHCAGSHRNEVAELLLAFSKELSKRYGNINARVMLQPVYDGISPYMHYFGSNRLGDGSYRETGQLQSEWYESYYMRGVEWGNILSPRLMAHLPCLKEDSITTKNIQLENLGNGAYMLRSLIEIDSFDVEEALELKKLVVDALYPGGTSYSISRLFPKEGFSPKLLRKDWAIVPIFESEINIIAKDLVFCAYSR